MNLPAGRGYEARVGHKEEDKNIYRPQLADNKVDNKCSRTPLNVR